MSTHTPKWCFVIPSWSFNHPTNHPQIATNGSRKFWIHIFYSHLQPFSIIYHILFNLLNASHFRHGVVYNPSFDLPRRFARAPVEQRNGFSGFIGGSEDHRRRALALALELETAMAGEKNTWFAGKSGNVPLHLGSE